MSEAQSILIVEDEEPIRQGLISLFVYHGYQVEAVTDGESGLSRAKSGKFDLIVLDVMLPKRDGFSVCHELRLAKLRTPIVMLTARTSEDDIINGLQLGADDYVTKPFSVREFLLRVQAILRRTSAPPVETIELRDHMRIETANLEGTGPGGRVVFTHREIEILKYLLSKAGCAKTRDDLLVNVWGYSSGAEFDTRTVDIHVAKLRKKIEPDPKNPVFLVTVRTLGYQLRPDGV